MTVNDVNDVNYVNDVNDVNDVNGVNDINDNVNDMAGAVPVTVINLPCIDD